MAMESEDEDAFQAKLHQQFLQVPGEGSGGQQKRGSGGTAVDGKVPQLSRELAQRYAKDNIIIGGCAS